MLEYLVILPATLAGYLIFKATTNPTARIRRKMPNVIIKERLHLFPVFRMRIFGRVIHFHHWVNLSILLGLSFFITSGILTYLITKGVLLGGIIHGLRLPKEHRKIMYKDFSLPRLTKIAKKIQKEKTSAY